jgi:endonuclease YncB( thermonuclease family)
MLGDVGGGVIDSRRRIWGGPAAALLGAVLCGAGSACAAEIPCLEDAEPARVASVPDARTLTLEDGRVLRIAGLEPFDLIVPGLEDAEAMLRERIRALALGQPVLVRLIGEGSDRYGRHPALIVADGALLQETLAREGLAVAFASGDALPCFDRILAAEADARRAARGEWPESPLPEAEPQALQPFIGYFTIFEGEVLSVGNRAARTYLNFGTRWTDDVTVEIEARDRKHFGGEEVLSALAGQRVRIRGFLESKAGPMMAIRSPMQLEILGAAASERKRAP